MKERFTGLNIIIVLINLCERISKAKKGLKWSDGMKQKHSKRIKEWWESRR